MVECEGQSDDFAVVFVVDVVLQELVLFDAFGGVFASG